MKLRTLSSWFLAATLLTVPASRAVAWGAPSAPVVNFTLESSGGGNRTLEAYRGKVVVLFYEDRHHTETNARVKEAVGRYGLANGLQDKVAVVAVANLKGFDFAPASTIARKAIQTIASRFKIEILMDWRGALIDGLGMKDANANVAVIDPDGHLRWRNSGRLSEEDQKSLLSSVQASLPQEGAANPGTN